MAQSIRVSDEMYDAAQQVCAAMGRSLAQQLEYWARIGAAVDAAGITSVQLTEILSTPAATRALVDLMQGRLLDGPEVGSPMLREWHSKLDSEVASGVRSASSLLAFEPDAVHASQVVFAREPAVERGGEW